MSALFLKTSDRWLARSKLWSTGVRGSCWSFSGRAVQTAPKYIQELIPRHQHTPPLQSSPLGVDSGFQVLTKITNQKHFVEWGPFPTLRLYLGTPCPCAWKTFNKYFEAGIQKGPKKPSSETQWYISQNTLSPFSHVHQLTSLICPVYNFVNFQGVFPRFKRIEHMLLQHGFWRRYISLHHHHHHPFLLGVIHQPNSLPHCPLFSPTFISSCHVLFRLSRIVFPLWPYQSVFNIRSGPMEDLKHQMTNATNLHNIAEQIIRLRTRTFTIWPTCKQTSTWIEIYI